MNDSSLPNIPEGCAGVLKPEASQSPSHGVYSVKTASFGPSQGDPSHFPPLHFSSSGYQILWVLFGFSHPPSYFLALCLCL